MEGSLTFTKIDQGQSHFIMGDVRFHFECPFSRHIISSCGIRVEVRR